ncbi:unnamed protein product [Adineta ricciae]|uniref:Uncharacterized protein n=2 Tax=Adineta ricciae TaxID=249248 RepID=A0A814NWT9_ADIRI|nr:unnamed protein product [Adineta ricciae]
MSNQYSFNHSIAISKRNLITMRTIFFNAILCFFIVIIGVTLSSSVTLDQEDRVPTHMDWIDLDSYVPAHQLDARAAKSRFWKRAPHRHFWKRSASMINNDLTKSESN